MKFDKIHNKGQAQLFKNQSLELLTKTHPLVIWGIYIPIIGFSLYYTAATLNQTAGFIILVFLSGAFFWSLFEYLMHRFIFHFVSESEKAMKVIYIIHGNHHEYPRDKQRLFMPPVPSLFLASLVFGTMYFFGWMVNATAGVFPFFAGFVTGYLVYGTMHYAIHSWAPPYKWMKPLWRNHHLHHYKKQEKGFGVSSTLWDHVFGTMFDLRHEVDDKQKVEEQMFTNN